MNEKPRSKVVKNIAKLSINIYTERIKSNCMDTRGAIAMMSFIKSVAQFYEEYDRNGGIYDDEVVTEEELTMAKDLFANSIIIIENISRKNKSTSTSISLIPPPLREFENEVVDFYEDAIADGRYSWRRETVSWFFLNIKSYVIRLRHPARGRE